jgi:hypothetical protein
MKTTILKVLGATLIAATTIQVADATENHARKPRAPAVEQFRNSNAYAAPGDIAAQSSYLSNLANGAQASGVAGR